MITPHTRRFNGKSYTFTTGIDEAGKAPTKIDHAEPSEKLQPVRTVLKELVMSCDDEGNLVDVKTTYTEQQFDNAGNVIRGYSRDLVHHTKPEELPLFVQRFLPMLQPSVYNGWVRGGKYEGDGFLGQSMNPAFDSTTGAFIAGTLDNETLAPDYAYHAPTV